MLLILAPIIFAVVAYLAWRNRAVRGCRWRADSTRDKGALRMYRCMACGAEAFTATKGQPQTCKKGLSGPSL
jgi:hypothetical protein